MASAGDRWVPLLKSFCLDEAPLSCSEYVGDLEPPRTRAYCVVGSASGTGQVQANRKPGSVSSVSQFTVEL